MKYEVTYTESYASTYVVEANSEDHAKEIVEFGISNGNLEPPNNCYDSSYHVVEVQ